MGISGLLVGLKSTACVTGHIRDFAGQAVAVDASSWLHKSVYSIADHYVECVENHKTVDRRCIEAASNYIIRRCQELSCAGIVRVFLVMDGQRCPLKAQTNQDREKRRLQNLHQAREYKQLGKYDRMYEKYKTCIKVHPKLGQEVVKEVQRKLKDSRIQIQTVWAPYEADPQLIQLCVEGLAQAVITEDSDVLVYSATTYTPVPVIFKLDGQSGTCDIISMNWLFDAKNTSFQVDEQKKKKASGIEAFLQTFSTREERVKGLGVRLFVQACVFAGCDYAPNELGGIGTVTSFKHIRNNIHRNAEDRFRSILQQCGKQGTPEYEVLLRKSETVFYYHPVLDVGTGQVKYLNDPYNATEHQPKLERFGSDWSHFLGDVEISVKPGSVSASRENQQPNVPKLFSAAAFAKRKDVAISNPYVRTGKRPRDGDTESKTLPLRTISSNTSDADRESLAAKCNPFSNFSLENPNSCLKAETLQRKKDALASFYGDNEDVRGVKRIFPKDGTRVTLKQKPIDLPKCLPVYPLSDQIETLIADDDDVEEEVHKQSDSQIITAENERVTSRFFTTGERITSRRVSYEPESVNCSKSEAQDCPQQHTLHNTFEDDDVWSPKKALYDAQPLNEDAIVESSPKFASRLPSLHKPFANQPICFQVGPLSLPSTRPKALQGRSNSNAMRGRGDKQTTLLKHFNVKAEHNSD
ncbi:exonuclease 1 [Fistulifera solaris]|uniref:Exonuclease 1 n=1 Tax=Fistulifera solaris TaxID=1519565 RepID=A0A1Z5JIJ2_FISSO|nr:exonuclease 1 [Fistulifera solaris]|eukprot:GAX13581.1 exonuclease 1 [Fistulifera solaris]